jgi:hypothetical protein
MTDVIECPNSNDVVFRQGTSLYCHPGNARFRSLVESKVIQLRNNLQNDDCKSGKDNRINFNTNNTIKSNDTSSPTSALISEIIDHIISKEEGRVLVWTPNHNNEKYGCWCTITNEDQIYSKIEYTVREHIRGGGSSVATTLESSTSIFRMDSSSNAATNFLPGPLSCKRAKSFKRACKRAKICSPSNLSDPSSSDDDS